MRFNQMPSSLYFFISRRHFNAKSETLDPNLLRCLSLRDLAATRRFLAESPHLSHNTRLHTSLLSRLAGSGFIDEALHLLYSLTSPNTISHNALISSLARCGLIDLAHNLFDEMPERNSASWNALISAYASLGRISDARRLFDAMSGDLRNVVSWTALIAGYCRAGDVSEAFDLFSTMIPTPNVVTWTAMIGGFAWNGFYEDALLLFKQMLANRTVDLNPNTETIISAVYACSGIGIPRLGEQIHAYLTVHGMNGCDSDGRLSKALIRMYSNFALVGPAQWLFDAKKPTHDDATCWNSLIEGYVRIGRLDKARRLFDEITAVHDKISWITMVVTWTTMITAYLDGGDVLEAGVLFDRMPQKDATAWTAMISGMVRNEMILEAFDLFSGMRAHGLTVMDHAFASLLGAVGATARLEIGVQLHGLILRTRPATDTILCNALVGMYAKCGDVAAAWHVFDDMRSRDVISWNSLIMGLAHHGRADEALVLFNELVTRGEDGLQPDGVTFLGALTACGHAGLVNRGSEIFKSMDSNRVEPGMEHYACVVDMLGRAGKLEEAVRFIDEMRVEPGLEVWGSLLGTCGMGIDRAGSRRWVGEWAAKRLFEMDPTNGPGHVALCHVYAREVEGHVAEGKVRREMGRKGVWKAPGCSWIEVKGKVHIFYCGENANKVL